MKKKVGWAVACAGLLCGSGQLVAAPVAAELDRPAIVVAHPERAVLLGIAAAGKRLVSVGERGLIIVSDDFGLTWRQVATPVSVSLTAVHFVNARSGWAVGHQGVILHSADGGEHWQLQLDGNQAAQLALAAVQAQRTPPNADPLEHERRLKDAERLVEEGVDKPFFDIHFQNDHTGWAIGAYGLCFHTTDGGETWQPWMQHLANPDGLHLYAMTGSGQTLYVAGERGLLLSSSDGGISFHAVHTPYQGSFFTLTSTSPYQLILAGMDGHAYRSDDSGKSWHALINSGGGTWMASTALSGNRALLADQFGQLMVSQSQANTLVRLDSTPGVPLAAVLQTGDGNLVAVGLRGISRIPLPTVAGAVQ
ncbi:MAG: glycosyl hydrolase [Comamonadaceae bacterium]|nr:glycosyl hydrolase [Comamonadaceae bacterium]